jgi:protein MpaA
MTLVQELRPRAVVTMHAPLGCVLDPDGGPLARWLSEGSGLPLRRTIDAPTPGMFDTWVREHAGVEATTLELPVISKDRALVRYLPVLMALLRGEA